MRERNTADVDIFGTSGETSFFDLEGRDNDLTGFVFVGLIDRMVQETNAAHNLQVEKEHSTLLGTLCVKLTRVGIERLPRNQPSCQEKPFLWESSSGHR